MNATLTKHITWLLMGVCVVSVSAAAKAQSALALAVSPAEQASRDKTRQQILEAELKNERAAGAKAQQRASERGQAGDPVGVAEAQTALRQHNTNIAALRREIEFTASSPRVLPSVAARREPAAPDASLVRVFVRSPSRAAEGGERAAPQAVAAPAALRPWDMYEARRAAMPEARPPTTQVMEPSVPLPTTGVADQGGSVAPAWDMYRKQAVVRAAAGAVRPPAEEPVRIDVGPREPPAVPFLVYRDPNAVARTRFPVTRSDNRN